jgi:uncharacterized lipoprotein
MLTKSHLTTTVLLAITLFGCSSFNTYHYPTPIVILTAPEKTETPVPATTATPSSDCVYRMPQLQTMPEVPLQELEKIGDKDDAALDRIQQDYMKELRAYIRRRQAVHRAAYQEYLKRCAPGINQHDGKNTD